MSWVVKTCLNFFTLEDLVEMYKMKKIVRTIAIAQ